MKLRLFFLSFLFQVGCCHAAIPLTLPDGFTYFQGKKIYVKFDRQIHNYNVYAEVFADMDIEQPYKSLVILEDHPNHYLGLVTLNFERDFDNLSHGDSITLAYQLPKLDNPKCFELSEYGNVLFFFLDIDMDGKTELIVRGNHDGSYFADTYRVYEIRHHNEELIIRSDPPFDCLDSRSKVYFTNKEIILTNKDGVNINYIRYKFLNDQWQLILPTK